MRRVGRRIGQAITVALLAIMAGGTAYLAVSATGCEGSMHTGFCAAPDMPPVVSWDHGPGGTTVTVGPVEWHTYGSEMNGGATVAVGSLCGGAEFYGHPGLFWGCDQ